MRTGRRALGLLSIAVALAGGGCRRAEPQPGSTPPAEAYREAAEALSEAIRYELEDKSIPAISIALVDGQEVVWAQGFGMEDPESKRPATAATIYRAGSISKLLTDIAVMQKVEKGELDPDAPVTTYLPGFQPRNPFGKPITLRQLMTHRSGLVREPPAGHYFDDSGTSLRQTVESLNDTALVYAPETRIKYSNAGVAVAGYVLEHGTGTPFAEHVRDRVLKPLGMNASFFGSPGPGGAGLAKARMWTYSHTFFPAPTFELGMSPAGSLYSSAEDLAQFLKVIFAEGRGPSGPVLQPETLALMMQPQYPGTVAGSRNFGLGFSLGDLDGRPVAGHGGAIYGFASELLLLPREQLGVVVLASLEGANAVTERLAKYALKQMLYARQRGDDPGPWEKTFRPVPEFVRETAGLYEGPDGRIRMLEEDGDLYLVAQDRKARVRAFSDHLMVDDRHAWGPLVERPEEAANVLRINRMDYRKISDPQPAAPPAAWQGLIGQYGWDHNVLYILEDEGKLYALIEWFFRYPLTAEGSDVFAFPDRGLYHGEKLRFRRGRDGRAVDVVAAGIVFPRRPDHPGKGPEFRIDPVRPVAELRAEAAKAHPPKETPPPEGFLPADLVDLKSAAPGVRLDIRYATANNFLGVPVYPEARAFLQRPAAAGVRSAQERLTEHGMGLLIHDAYRPWQITKVFWDATPPSMHDFVADPSRGSRHNRGCAVDLTLCDKASGRPAAMPSGYDEFSERAYPYFPGGSARERWNRDLLRHTMEREGFTVYEFEWWHFDYRDWRRYPIGNQPFSAIGAR